MAMKSYIMDELYSLKKRKKISQNSSRIDENIEQVNNGVVQELKVKIKLLENENKLLKEERDNYEKSHDTVLDHNRCLSKPNKTLHQHP